MNNERLCDHTLFMRSILVRYTCGVSPSAMVSCGLQEAEQDLARLEEEVARAAAKVEQSEKQVSSAHTHEK